MGLGISSKINLLKKIHTLIKQDGFPLPMTAYASLYYRDLDGNTPCIINPLIRRRTYILIKLKCLKNNWKIYRIVQNYSNLI